MSEKKQLNQEQLEKVTGGVKEVGSLELYEASDITSLKVDTKVSIFKGSYNGTTFYHMCDGVINSKMNTTNTNTTFVQVKGNNAVTYDFCTNGKCTINGVESDYWFGPEQIVAQYI